MSRSLTEFTEAEFLELVTKICSADYPSEKILDEAVSLFEEITEHPAKSDLIYYSEEGKGTPDAIVQLVKQWRAEHAKPGFKIE